jgi:hypothetical protein
MFKSKVVTTASTFLLLVGMLAVSGTASTQADKKHDDASAPTIKPKFFEKYKARDKTKRTSSVTAARSSAKQAIDPSTRESEFLSRGGAHVGEQKASTPAELPARIASRRPHLADQNKTSGVPPFIGRNGTGLGDIFEVNSGSDPDLAQIIDDLPANIVGDIGTFDDVDFYAITATAGERIRVEVTADRVFNSDLDSFLYLLDDDEDILRTNDDDFATSFDSFIAFDAPYTGIYYIGVTDSRGFGASDFDYVLSVSASRRDTDEDESNDTIPRSDTLLVPSTAFGKSNDDEDQDVYKFSGVAGTSIIVDVDAEIYLSDADMVVELLDNTSRLVFASDDFDGHDPRFNIVLPYTGTYYLLVYDLNRDEGSDGHYYSLNLSAQSAALAPRTTNYKTSLGRLKTVIGSNFDPNNGGSVAEIDADPQPSFNLPAHPTTKVRLSPTGVLSGSDSITVVNPDGRRSNPIILR